MGRSASRGRLAERGLESVTRHFWCQAQSTMISSRRVYLGIRVSFLAFAASLTKHEGLPDRRFAKAFGIATSVIAAAASIP